MMGLLRGPDCFPSPMLCEDGATPLSCSGAEAVLGDNRAEKYLLKQRIFIMDSVPKSLEQRLPLIFRNI